MKCKFEVELEVEDNLNGLELMDIHTYITNHLKYLPYLKNIITSKLTKIETILEEKDGKYIVSEEELEKKYEKMKEKQKETKEKENQSSKYYDGYFKP